MNNYKILNDKVVLITGASRGIGAEIAKTFGENGAKIAIVYLKNKNSAQKTKRFLESLGTEADVFCCDISKVNSIKSLLRLVAKRFKKIDILINNAGVIKQTPFDKITEREYDWILNTNLKGAFFMAQFTLSYLLKSRGSIINIASVGGQRGGPKAPHYSASKAGIISLTRSLSNLYAPKGVRVNAISPGQIETEIAKDIFKTAFYKKEVLPKIPLRRIGKTSDVANAALFLASDLSDYITGQTINVNGGEYLG